MPYAMETEFEPAIVQGLANNAFVGERGTILCECSLKNLFASFLLLTCETLFILGAEYVLLSLTPNHRGICTICLLYLDQLLILLPSPPQIACFYKTKRTLSSSKDILRVLADHQLKKPDSPGLTFKE